MTEDVDGLFPPPEPEVRHLVPVPAQDAARRVEELVPAGEYL